MPVFYVFLLGMLLGGIFELLLSAIYDSVARRPFRIVHRLNLLKRISLLSLPIWGILAVIFVSNSLSYGVLFIYAAILGTLLEFLVGKFFYEFFGVNVWTYRHGAIGRYTSIYSIPYWGAFGLMFTWLVKFVGI